MAHPAGYDGRYDFGESTSYSVPPTQYRRRVNTKRARRHRRGCGCGTLIGILLFLISVVVCAALFYEAIVFISQQNGDWFSDASSLFEEIVVPQEEIELIEDTDVAALTMQTGVFSDDIVRYGYNTLSANEQAVYIAIADCLLNMSEDVSFASETLTESRLDDIYCIVCADYPEIFGMSAYRFWSTQQGTVTQWTIEPCYDITAEEKASRLQEIEQVAAAFLSTVAEDATDYEKAKAVYTYVVNSTSYVSTDEDQNMYGALIEQQAVCAGYASAVQYLLQKMGIMCYYVSGTAVGTQGTQSAQAHAWNLVLLDGAYYYIDATWGDGSYLDADGLATGIEQLDYSYLCVTDADLASTHTANDLAPLPQATSNACNYYYAEGLVVQSSDYEAVKAVLSVQLEGEYFYVRCTDAESFAQVRTLLFEEDGFFKILNELGIRTATSCSYSVNESLYTMKIQYSS